MSVIALPFPATRERARALSVWGAISSSGLIIGVLLSGVLTELVGWRAIFLLLAIVRAAESGWTDATVTGALLFSGAAFSTLVVVERRSRDPLIPSGLFAHRVRLVVNAATALLSAALSTTFFLSTLYSRTSWGSIRCVPG